VSDPDCIFCKIVAEEIPADVVYSDDQVVAFRDIDPQAPTHILVIPREHIASVNDLTENHTSVAGHLTLVAKELAKKDGLAESGYRLVLNTGPDGGQAVFHIHLHLFGGRPMGWPPG
jgi:histidine triad (HIT) family protein